MRSQCAALIAPYGMSESGEKCRNLNVCGRSAVPPLLTVMADITDQRPRAICGTQAPAAFLCYRNPLASSRLWL
jgi:hypothetical protein